MLLCRSVGKSILSPGVASGLVKVGRERERREKGRGRGFLSNQTSPTKVTTLSSALARVLLCKTIASLQAVSLMLQVRVAQLNAPICLALEGLKEIPPPVKSQNLSVLRNPHW